MPILTYRYRLMPTPSQAEVLGRSMSMMRWGWNLMVRRTSQVLKVIQRGCAGTVQSRLAARIAAKEVLGRRAAMVNKLTAEGMNRQDAEKAVRKELSSRAFTYQRSRLAMEMALMVAEAAKQGQMGSALGSAWGQLARKYRFSWEACWKGLRGAPTRKPSQDGRWIQASLPDTPAVSVFKHPSPWGPHSENWINLSRFFPLRLRQLPERITKGTAKSLDGLKGASKTRELKRLKSEFLALSDVRLLQHRPLPDKGVITSVKINRSSNRADAVWHVSLAVEVPEEVALRLYPMTGKACGINPARRYALTLVGDDCAKAGVDGLELSPGRAFSKISGKLARLHRKLDRQRRANNPECFDNRGRWIKGMPLYRTSKRMLRTQAQMRSLNTQAVNRRLEVYHRITENLLVHYDSIFLGDWKGEPHYIRRAKKRELKAKIQREGFDPKNHEPFMRKLGEKMDRENALGVFRRVLAEKVARSGGSKLLVLVPEPYTTQACAQCRALTGPKGFRVQGWWTCSICGYQQLRHRTAAYNILQDGLKASSEDKVEPNLGAGWAPKKSPKGGKGAGQALKGGDDSAVGRMPEKGKGTLVSGPARRNRKAPTPGALEAAGSSAPERAMSTVTSREGSRAAGLGEHPVSAAGKASSRPLGPRFQASGDVSVADEAATGCTTSIRTADGSHALGP